MSRSDGQFPAYTKLDVDSESWPDNYWDQSHKCLKCGKRWPFTHLFAVSVCCGANTVADDNAPDMRWPEAVYELNNVRFDDLYGQWNENKKDEELEWEDVKTNGDLDPGKVSEAVDTLIKTSKPKVRPYKGMGH